MPRNSSSRQRHRPLTQPRERPHPTSPSVPERWRASAKRLLAEATEDLSQLSAPGDIIKAVAPNLCDFLAVARCTFVLIDLPPSQRVVAHDWHAHGEGDLALSRQRRLFDFITHDQYRAPCTGDMIVVRDTRRDVHAGKAYCAARNIRSYLMAPFGIDGHWQFLVRVAHTSARDWQPEEIDLVHEWAARIWLRVQGARAEIELRESEAKYRTLFESIDEGYALCEAVYGTGGRVEDIRYLDVNPAFTRLMGIDATGKTVLGVNPAVEPYWFDVPTRVVATGEPERFEAYSAHLDRWLDVYFARVGDGRSRKFVAVFQDATARKQSEASLRKTQEELERRAQERTAELAEAVAALQAEVRERRAAEEENKALFERLVTVQEEERRRIARDIHDQIGQHMTALRMGLEGLRTVDGDPRLGQQSVRVRHLAEELDQMIDFLAWDLRPAALDHLGLTAALNHLVDGWSRLFGIDAEFAAASADSVRLAPQVEAHLYRVAQEALHNVYKHARASHVSVFLERRDRDVLLIVEDDGCGFAPEAVPFGHGGHLGLIGIRERATLVGGQVEIESAPGHGTTLFVRVPVGDGADREPEPPGEPPPPEVASSPVPRGPSVRRPDGRRTARRTG